MFFALFFPFLRLILHFSQDAHDFNRLRLTDEFLNLRVMDTHENIVFLEHG